MSDIEAGPAKTLATPTQSGSGLPENIAGALAYVLGPITGIGFFILDRDRPFVRFHAVQCIALSIVGVAVSIALTVLRKAIQGPCEPWRLRGNVGETDGTGQERQVGWGVGCFGEGRWSSGRTSGGAGRRRGSARPALIEVVVRNGFRLSWIELGRLVEVVGEEFLGGLLCFPTDVRDAEFGLGWPPGGMEERG